MSAVHFTSQADASALDAKLQEHGYATVLQQEAVIDDGTEEHDWILMVQPLDDTALELARSHGGWLPDDTVELDAAAGLDDMPQAPPKTVTLQPASAETAKDTAG